MKSIFALSASLLLSAPTAHADELPAPLTRSGTQFVKLCADQALDQMSSYRRQTCQRLRTQWQLEMQLRDAGIAHVDLSGTRAGRMSGDDSQVRSGTEYRPPNFVGTTGTRYAFPTAERAATGTSGGRR